MHTDSLSIYLHIITFPDVKLLNKHTDTKKQTFDGSKEDVIDF